MDDLAFDTESFLAFWFESTREYPERIPDRKAWWFDPDPERDRQLEALHLQSCEAARAGRLDDLAETPGGCMALILLLDQLPRHLSRGTAEAFTSDARALELCLEGHRSGLDQPLTLIERVFFWMPLQHAEDLERQERISGRRRGEGGSR